MTNILKSRLLTTLSLALVLTPVPIVCAQNATTAPPATVPATAAPATYADALKAGQEKEQRKDWNGARADFTVALGLATQPSQKALAQLARARSYQGDGQGEQARAEFAKVPDIAGASATARAEAHAGIALSWFSAKEWGKGREELAKISALADLAVSNKIAAQVVPLSALVAAQQVAAAREEYTKLLLEGASGPQRAGLMTSLAATYRAEKNSAEERKTLENILTLEGARTVDKSAALTGIGDSYAAEKNGEEARKAYGRALALPDMTVPGKARVQNLIGRSLANDKNHAAARAEYVKTLEMAEALPDQKSAAQMGIVETWLAEGNNAEAKAALEKLLAMPGLPASTKTRAEGMLQKL